MTCTLPDSCRLLVAVGRCNHYRSCAVRFLRPYSSTSAGNEAINSPYHRLHLSSLFSLICISPDHAVLLEAVRTALGNSPIREKQEELLSFLLAPQNSRQLSTVVADLNCQHVHTHAHTHTQIVYSFVCFFTSDSRRYLQSGCGIVSSQSNRFVASLCCLIIDFNSAWLVGEGIELAVKLFELSHSLGDTDSTYTYAQLLRTGEPACPTSVCYLYK